ncbi:MAG: TetR/AcrR family transcriptional regulator [Dehalococcoidia bacterium]
MSLAAGATDEAARRAIIGAADAVFYARGVGGAGMIEVRDAAGVSLRRLYSLYPSKRALVAAWLESRHQAWMGWLTSAVARLEADGLGPIDAVFGALAAWASSPGYRGCAFLNTAAEVCEIDDLHREIIARHKRGLRAYLQGMVAKAGVGGAEARAAELAVLVDGAIVQSAVFSSLEPIEAARLAAARLMAAAA